MPSTTIGSGTPRMSMIPGGFVNICREYAPAQGKPQLPSRPSVSPASMSPKRRTSR